ARCQLEFLDQCICLIHGNKSKSLSRGKSAKKQPTSFLLNMPQGFGQLRCFVLSRQIILNRFHGRQLRDFKIETKWQDSDSRTFCKIVYCGLNGLLEGDTSREHHIR